MNKDEQVLRENIRQLIRHVKQKKLCEEKEVRNSLKKLMRLELKKLLSEAATPDTDPTPNKSTFNADTGEVSYQAIGDETI